MWSQIIEILQWAFPAGLSLFSLFLWREMRRQKKASITADTVDTWKRIAESNNKALLDRNEILIHQNEQILKLQLSIQNLNGQTERLEIMLEQIAFCAHYEQCPVRHGVQDYKAKYGNKRKRQRPDGRKAENKHAETSGEPGGDGDLDPGLVEPSAFG